MTWRPGPNISKYFYRHGILLILEGPWHRYKKALVRPYLYTLRSPILMSNKYCTVACIFPTFRKLFLTLLFIQLRILINIWKMCLAFPHKKLSIYLLSFVQVRDRFEGVPRASLYHDDVEYQARKCITTCNVS